MNPGIASTNGRYAIEVRNLRVYYGSFQAIKDIDLQIDRHKITAIIGPSGCGKSTMLRVFNRVNELVPTARTEGEVLFEGINIYDEDIDPVRIRRRIGMVFQKPNPFSKSIHENVAWGAQINGYRDDVEDLVVESLKQAALWDEAALYQPAYAGDRGLCDWTIRMSVKRVLFMCTGNSARSQMAEGLVNHLLGDTWEAYSAGTKPSGYVHPLAIEAMAELGIDISAQRSKSADEFREMDLDRVITVCDQAAKKCPAWLGKGRVKHIGFPDPAAAQGSRSEQLKVFRQVRDGLRDQVFAYLQQDDDPGMEVFYLATGGI